MKKQFLTGALFAGTLALGVIAQADPAEAITFDFDGSTGTSFTEGGLGVVATADATLGTPVVTNSSDGLGIRSSRFDTTPFQIDSIGPDESLNLTFDKLVKPLFATLKRVSVADDASVTLQSVTLDLTEIFSGDIPGGGFFNGFEGTIAFNNSTTPFGQVLTFGTNDGFDSYTLSSLEVEVIPTPALLPGLLGMGAAALRKRKQEAEA